jgi:PPOX class probable F420-dependent enzyme
MAIDLPEAIERVESSRIARLASTRPDGHPHIVPITFASIGESLVTMIDHKPKTTHNLQRLRNIESSPHVSVIVDEWSEDWERLWWVRLDGSAFIHQDDDVWREARMALVTKYRQYQEHPPVGPAILITIDRVTSWEGTRRSHPQ